MQTTEQNAAPSVEQMARERPLVERWLTWSGVLPLPAFLVLHLGRELSLAFAHDVAQLLREAPSVPGVVTSALLVWLPLVVHGALGVYCLATGRGRRSGTESAAAALARRVSRFSSVPALAFVVYHGWQFPIAVWLGHADARDAGFRLVGLLASTSGGLPLAAVLYLLGLSATVAHASLALHRALAGEGLLDTEARLRASARACTIGGAVLFAVGASAVIRVASGALLR
jgi:succinate dehydrogenase/fumarate reductase cytochrome b subunit